MIENIGEPISVDAAFYQGRCLPHSFTWRRALYQVLRVTSFWNSYEGQFHRFFYTVCTEQAKIYEIAFSTKNLQWILIKIYHDGN